MAWPTFGPRPTQLGAALGEALTRSGPDSFSGAEPESTRSHCPIVEGDACAGA